MLSNIEAELSKIVDFYKSELSRLQIGRANASLVDHIEVESYGTKQPIKNLANISIPDAKQIAIQPWDKSILSAIEKAIQEAKLGFNPVNDGVLIRINIPALTEERRRELSKLVWKMAEESKISVRNIRQDFMKNVKATEKDVGEDEVKRQEKLIQEKVDKTNKEIDELGKKKEEDIMKV